MDKNHHSPNPRIIAKVEISDNDTLELTADNIEILQNTLSSGIGSSVSSQPSRSSVERRNRPQRAIRRRRSASSSSSSSSSQSTSPTRSSSSSSSASSDVDEKPYFRDSKRERERMKNERKTFAEERKMTARQIKRWKRYQKYQQKRAEERKKQRNEQLLRQREQTRSSNSSRLSKSPPRHMEHQPQIIHIHLPYGMPFMPPHAMGPMPMPMPMLFGPSRPFYHPMPPMHHRRFPQRPFQRGQNSRR